MDGSKQEGQGIKPLAFVQVNAKAVIKSASNGFIKNES
jgi:hypothetical protein